MPEMHDDDIILRHEPERRRFVAETPEGRSVLDYAVIDADTVDYRHTYVPVALRGQGIATKLVGYALEHARAERLAVIPTCPFVASVMERRPEYRALRARERGRAREA